MKLFILSVCVVLAAGDVSHVVGKTEADAPIVRQEFEMGPEGQYKWGFETGNGISGSETGASKQLGPEETAEVVQGEAKWTAPDGQVIEFQYIADENGYQPQGAFLPTPPPIPEAILRGLEYIRAHPPPVEKN